MIPDSVLESAVSVYLLGSSGLRMAVAPSAATILGRILYRMADVGRPTSSIISVTVTNWNP
jgi:hypothetical protein